MWLEIQPGKRERAAAGVLTAAQREHKPSWLWPPDVLANSSPAAAVAAVPMAVDDGEEDQLAPCLWKTSSGSPRHFSQQARGAASVGSRRSTGVGSAMARHCFRSNTKDIGFIKVKNGSLKGSKD